MNDIEFVYVTFVVDINILITDYFVCSTLLFVATYDLPVILPLHIGYVHGALRLRLLFTFVAVLCYNDILRCCPVTTLFPVAVAFGSHVAFTTLPAYIARSCHLLVFVGWTLFAFGWAIYVYLLTFTFLHCPVPRCRTFGYVTHAALPFTAPTFDVDSLRSPFVAHTTHHRVVR